MLGAQPRRTLQSHCVYSLEKWTQSPRRSSSFAHSSRTECKVHSPPSLYFPYTSALSESPEKTGFDLYGHSFTLVNRREVDVAWLFCDLDYIPSTGQFLYFQEVGLCQKTHPKQDIFFQRSLFLPTSAFQRQLSSIAWTPVLSLGYLLESPGLFNCIVLIRQSCWLFV